MQGRLHMSSAFAYIKKIKTMCQSNCNKLITSVTISATTSAANINFPDNARIRDAKVVGISMRRSGSSTLYDTNGNTLAADTVVAGAHIRIVDLYGTELQKLPLSTLQRDFNSPEYQCFNLDKIDPIQSSINLNTAAAGYSATAVIEMTFYLDPAC
jgi:hypothetical protein